MEDIKTGRPTYNIGEVLKHKELIINWFSNGISFVGFLAQLHKETGVYLPKSTLYDILKRVKEGNGSEEEQTFSDILSIGRLYSQQWWEATGRNNLIGTKEGGTLNAGVYNKLISHMFPDDYKEFKDKIEVKTGDTEVSINIGGDSYE